MKHWNYLMGHILYQVFKITSNISLKNMDLKKHGEKTDNLSKRIYLNKVENEIMFKIKTGYYLELLALETMKLP